MCLLYTSLQIFTDPTNCGDDEILCEVAENYEDCIARELVCDGINHCFDKKDEQDCAGK